MFRIVFSPAGFPNFCHNFCLALQKYEDEFTIHIYLVMIKMSQRPYTA